MIHGALAAAVTPLRDGGRRLDEDAFGPVAVERAEDAAEQDAENGRRELA